MTVTTLSDRIKKLAKKKNKLQPGNGKPINAKIYAEMVEKKAYELYEKRGGENGNDWDDWFKAERLVEEEMIKEA